MAGPNFNLPYPPVLNNNVNLQTVKALVSLGYVTVVNVYTTAQATTGTLGRFFVTDIVIHDPTQAAGASASAVVSFGSASTSTTALSPVFPLTVLNASVTGQYLRVPVAPAFGWANQGVTTTYTTAPGNVGVALGPGDTFQMFVQTAAGTTSVTAQIDLIGYYI